LGLSADKALSDPEFFIFGLTAELKSQSRVLFTSFNLQTRATRKEHHATGHGSFSSSHSMTQLGANVNFVIVPLRTIQP
jgi:hypothetical protein